MVYTAHRSNGRLFNQIRPLTVQYGVSGNAHGSVLLSLGNTRILCSVHVQDGVPHFLKGKGQGWLSAEYALLPGSTQQRTTREISVSRRDGRSVEISRLIGRSLRAILDFSCLPERTIYVDCDVIQADGGTRTAAILAAYAALLHASQNSFFISKVNSGFLKDSLGALSVGWSVEGPLLDIDFAEDSTVIADFNFVMTGTGAFVEVQGTTEKEPLAWNAIEEMRILAAQGIATALESIEKSLPSSVLRYSQMQKISSDTSTVL